VCAGVCAGVCVVLCGVCGVCAVCVRCVCGVCALFLLDFNKRVKWILLYLENQQLHCGFK